MADTSRTLAAILALLADNTTGAISPQDLRDAVLSIMSGYGSITVIGGSTAQTSISGTPAKMTGFAANGLASQTTPSHADDKITVAVAGSYLAQLNMSFSGTASKTFTFAVFVDGVASVLSCAALLGAAGTGGCASCGAVLALNASSYVEVYVSSADGGTSVTPVSAQLSVTRVD